MVTCMCMVGVNELCVARLDTTHGEMQHITAQNDACTSHWGRDFTHDVMLETMPLTWRRSSSETSLVKAPAHNANTSMLPPLTWPLTVWHSLCFSCKQLCPQHHTSGTLSHLLVYFISLLVIRHTVAAPRESSHFICYWMSYKIHYSLQQYIKRWKNTVNHFSSSGWHRTSKLPADLLPWRRDANAVRTVWFCWQKLPLGHITTLPLIT